jgi:shikimate kinase
MKRHIVLVGLPGSGKSTVGRLAAGILKAAFTDTDEIVVAAAGMPVAELFAGAGEAHFRRMERAAIDGALAAPPHVVAPGSGWMAQPGNLEAASEAVLIYLKVLPETAAARLLGDTSRPLLMGGDPEARIRELLAPRERWYRQAHAELDAAGAAEAVATEVVRRARSLGGW